MTGRLTGACVRVLARWWVCGSVRVRGAPDHSLARTPTTPCPSSWGNTRKLARRLGVSLSMDDAQLSAQAKEGDLGKLYRSRLSYQVRFLRYAVHYDQVSLVQ